MDIINEFGFTNDKARYDQVCAFRDAAVADGWSIKPTYDGHESIECAASLEKENFNMSVISRVNEKPKKYNYEASVHIWGPDGLSIALPDAYDWTEIQARLRYCGHCKARDVDTHRYSFAGRACANCLPTLKKKHEYPGWCD